MSWELEFSPDDDTLILFDGKLVFIFSNSREPWIFPTQGLTGITVSEGFGRQILFENRLGSSYGVSYDKDRYVDVLTFVESLEGVVGIEY